MKMRIAAAIAFAAGLAGCYHQSAVDQQSLEAVAPRSVVPAGRTFNVRMLDTIDSSAALPGQAFSAATVAPVRTAGGALVANAKAKVRGHVVSVRSGPVAALYLKFDSIDTVNGTQPLGATLAPRQGSPTLATPQEAGPEPGYDALLRFPPEGRLSAVGGGPSETGPLTTTAPPIQIPSGTNVVLLLTRPLSL